MQIKYSRIFTCEPITYTRRLKWRRKQGKAIIETVLPVCRNYWNFLKKKFRQLKN